LAVYKVLNTTWSVVQFILKLSAGFTFALPFLPLIENALKLMVLIHKIREH
jgi:hypothetical protein